MQYFFKKANIKQYKAMLDDYNNHFIIEQLKQKLPSNSSLLELGMGPGIDLVELNKFYQVLGSDNSPLWIEEFKKHHAIEAILLDAIEIDINQSFDCIYSNKVLQHLKKQAFITSLNNQYNHLNANGIIFMTLWVGQYVEEMMFDSQLRFVYYNETTLRKIIPSHMKIESIQFYREMEDNDSIIVIIRK